MEGLLDRVRNFFTGIGTSVVKILPVGKGSTHMKILDSQGLIDENLYQGHEEPKIVVREVAEPTKTALTELE
jgi:hypothetical protein